MNKTPQPKKQPERPRPLAALKARVAETPKLPPTALREEIAEAYNALRRAILED